MTDGETEHEFVFREQWEAGSALTAHISIPVVTGDITQIDLDGKASGLVHATDILDGVEGISVVKLTAKDVVRHPLVMRIIRAYEKDAEKPAVTDKKGKNREKGAEGV